MKVYLQIAECSLSSAKIIINFVIKETNNDFKTDDDTSAKSPHCNGFTQPTVVAQSCFCPSQREVIFLTVMIAQIQYK